MDKQKRNLCHFHQGKSNYCEIQNNFVFGNSQPSTTTKFSKFRIFSFFVGVVARYSSDTCCTHRGDERTESSPQIFFTTQPKNVACPPPPPPFWLDARTAAWLGQITHTQIFTYKSAESI